MRKNEGNFILVKEKEDSISRHCTIELHGGDRILASAEIRTAADIWVFQRITVTEDRRSEGFGSDVLKKLVEYLDANKIDLYANVHSSGNLSDEQLLAWYKRYGFVESVDRGYRLVKKYG